MSAAKRFQSKDDYFSKRSGLANKVIQSNPPKKRKNKVDNTIIPVTLMYEAFCKNASMFEIEDEGRFTSAESSLSDAVELHLSGEKTVLVNPLSVFGDTSWSVISFDLSEMIDLPFAKAKEYQIELLQHGIPSLIEVTEGGKGHYHLWVFYEEPVQGLKAAEAFVRLGLKLFAVDIETSPSLKDDIFVPLPLQGESVLMQRRVFINSVGKKIKNQLAVLESIELCSHAALDSLMNSLVSSQSEELDVFATDDLLISENLYNDDEETITDDTDVIEGAVIEEDAFNGDPVDEYTPQLDEDNDIDFAEDVVINENIVAEDIVEGVVNEEDITDINVVKEDVVEDEVVEQVAVEENIVEDILLETVDFLSDSIHENITIDESTESTESLPEKQAIEKIENVPVAEVPDGLHVMFTLGDMACGIPSTAVEKIMELTGFSTLPSDSDYFAGIVSVDDNSLSVINGFSLFGVAETGTIGKARIVIVDGVDEKFGLLVGSVNGIGYVTGTSIEFPTNIPATISHVVQPDNQSGPLYIFDPDALYRVGLQSDGQSKSKPSEAIPADEETQYVVFSSADILYGLPLEEVNEILPASLVKSLRISQGNSLEVLPYNGGSLPLMDLTKQLHAEDESAETSDFMLQRRVLVINKFNFPCGIITDRIQCIEPVSADKVRGVPSGMKQNAFIKGVARISEGDRVFMILDSSYVASFAGENMSAG